MQAAICRWRILLGFFAIGVTTLAMAGGEMPKAVCGETQWTAIQWHRYIAESQRAVRDAYAKAAEVEANALAERLKNVHVRPLAKDAYGDPLYTEYRPRAYAGTPSYIGPRTVASFEGGTPHVRSVSALGAQVHQPQIPATVPARVDLTLQPSGSHSYLQSGMRTYVGNVHPAWWRSVVGNR